MKLNNRISAKFDSLKKTGKTGLVTYLMGGDPNLQVSDKIINQLPNAGVDLIEIGLPFSDPMADGIEIQAAANRVLQQKIKVSDIFKLVNNFRVNDISTPIILMGYYNIILNYGIEKFCVAAAKNGVDGLIIVDLPPEEDELLMKYSNENDISLIKLITPTTDEHRLQVILESASGFLYYVSVAGITGTISASTQSVKEGVEKIRQYTDLPIAVGFGIKNKTQIDNLHNIADAVVVGSSIVKKIREINEKNYSDDIVAEQVVDYVKELS